jgi:general secretion pathway protein L
MTIAADRKPKRARVSAAAGRAFGWWLSELRATWQAVVRWCGRGTRNRLTIETGERYWIVRHGQRVLGQLDHAATDADPNRQRLVDLIPPSLKRRPIIVEIPQERVLSKRLLLPAGARAELERIIEFEMARHFPFPPERAFFCHRIVGGAGFYRSFGSGPIDIELIAVPRDLVDEIRRELARVGLNPSGIAVAGSIDEDRLVLPGAALGESGSVAVVHRALFCITAVLAVAAIVSLPLQQRVQLAEVERELDLLKPRGQALAEASDRQRREADRNSSVLRLRAARPPLVAVLAELSRAVPDGSWLLSLGITGREIVIDGLSPSAAATALALEQNRAVSGVVFRSPITRDPATGLEHFQLGASIGKAGP